MIQNIFSIEGILLDKKETIFRGKYRERLISIGTKEGETFHITAPFDWAEKTGELEIKQEVRIKFTIQSKTWQDKAYNTLIIHGLEIINKPNHSGKKVRTFVLRNSKKSKKNEKKLQSNS